MGLPVIRPMTPADVEPASAAMLLGDFGNRNLQLAFSASHPGCRAFVADADGAIVGTGIATINGLAAWIGTVWVEPSFRRRGLGLALTQAAIDAADVAGCRTLVLVATSAGRPLYERMGFAVQTEYRIVEAPGLGPEGGTPDPRIRPFHPDDLPAMAALDQAATGEDRAHLLAAFATPASARCLVDPFGGVRGFVVRAPWGGGATIVPDPDDAMADPSRATCCATRDRARPRGTPRRERRGTCEARGRRLDGGVARTSADPRRAVRLGSHGDLGPVQPRHGLKRGRRMAPSAWTGRAERAIGPRAPRSEDDVEPRTPGAVLDPMWPLIARARRCLSGPGEVRRECRPFPLAVLCRRSSQ